MVLLTNGISWYLRSHITVDRRSLEGTTPRTILGLIPVGQHRFEGDLDHVQAALGTKLYPDRLLVAALLGVLALSGLLGTVATALIGVGAVAFLLLGFVAVIRIHDQATRPVVVPVCLAHLPRARRLLDLIAVRSSALRAMPIQDSSDD